MVTRVWIREVYENERRSTRDGLNPKIDLRGGYDLVNKALEAGRKTKVESMRSMDSK